MEDVTPALVKFALEPAVGCHPEEKKSEKTVPSCHGELNKMWIS
jgi:hypothetical protein